MSDEYFPPFQVTEEITSLTIEIGQYVGSIAAFESLHPNPVLRKILAETMRITQRQVERMIAKMKKEGILVRHGASKNGFWEVVEKDL